jgi:hypothetical protein
MCCGQGCLSREAGWIAQTADVATVKGHKMGEPVTEYIASVPGGSEQLTNCRSAVADPKAARKLKLDPRSCVALVSAADQGARVEMNAGPAMPFGKATFDGGVLVKLTFPVGYNPLVPIRTQELIPFERVVADRQDGDDGTFQAQTDRSKQEAAFADRKSSID